MSGSPLRAAVVELYGLNDGFRIVGWGFECPYCEYRNEFVDEEEEQHECERCENTVTVIPIRNQPIKNRKESK